MNSEDIKAEHRSIVERYGPWGSANVALPFGLSTMDCEPRGDNYRTFKFLQIVADVLGRPLADLRIVDLASGEGLYAIEFAQHGADVLGIEGRAANVAKADFARRALGIDNLTFVEDDVRNFRAETYGSFDVVLCSGILYHLDQPDVFHFLENIRAACTGLCIIDARVAMHPDTSADFEGNRYWGWRYREHDDADSPDVKLGRLGSSLDNPQSFWFTRSSLANLLADLGFSSVFECLSPTPLNTRADRATFVARTGRPVRPYNSVGTRLGSLRWPDGRHD